MSDAAPDVRPGLVSGLVELVLPRRCVGCGEGAAVLCRACSPVGPPFAVPLGQPSDGLAVVAAAGYAAGMRRAIIAYKERDRRDLAGQLGALLALAVAELLSASPGAGAGVWLVAPPSTRAVAAARGGDHVLRLARAAVRAHGASERGPSLRVAPGVVRATRRVRDSAGLGVEERERNLAGSMAAIAPKDRAAPSGVVVVDDIVTTGATLRETMRALRAAGWPVLGGAVVAATPRRLMGSPLAGHRRAV